MSAKIIVDTSSGPTTHQITSQPPPDIELVATFFHGQQQEALQELKRAYETAVTQIEAIR